MNPPLSLVLAIDPGRDKCGLALVAGEGKTIQLRRVVLSGQMHEVIEELSRDWPFSHVVLGNSTASAQWRSKIEEWLPEVQIFTVDESNSSYEARALYWETY